MRRLDPGKLREALAAPGADTRQWTGYVLLDSEPSAEADGVYCDGICQPSGLPTTVRIAPLYVGAGVGIYLPAAKGDLLVCAFPEGDPGGGAVELARLPSAEDRVPDQVQGKPLDLWLIAAAGKDIRIRTSGGGVVRVEASQIHLVTTGQAATSKVIIDGVPWAGLQLTGGSGPAIGPPLVGASGAQAQAAYQQWLTEEQESDPSPGGAG